MSDVKARRGSENDFPVIQSPVIQDVIERCRRRKSVRNHKPILIYIIDWIQSYTTEFEWKFIGRREKCYEKIQFTSTKQLVQIDRSTSTRKSTTETKIKYRYNHEAQRVKFIEIERKKSRVQKFRELVDIGSIVFGNAYRSYKEIAKRRHPSRTCEETEEKWKQPLERCGALAISNISTVLLRKVNI